jgi:hypothetical protein
VERPGRGGAEALAPAPALALVELVRFSATPRRENGSLRRAELTEVRFKSIRAERAKAREQWVPGPVEVR